MKIYSLQEHYIKAMKLKDKIKQGSTLGTWITIDHPVIYQSIAEYPFDWVLIDLEHSAIDLSGLHQAITFFKNTNIRCLVRPPIVDNIYIKRIMDCGADGIIVPNIKNVDDINDAINYMKYPPEGSRGAGLFSAQNFGNNFESYYSNNNKESVLIVQIENCEAVKNLNEIVTIKHIDALMIGPYDLTSSLGIAGEFDNPLYLNELDKIKTIAIKNNIPFGMHIVEPDLDKLKKAREEGYSFLGYGLDFKFIISHLNQLKSFINE
jgi:2-dehydro-3-deoxyglucarate aldolase